MKRDGFHGRAGFGKRPALIVVDMNVGFTDAASPLHCDLEDTVGAIARLLAAARAARLPVVYTTVAYDEAGKEQAAVFIDKVPALSTLEAGSRFVEIDPRLAPQPGEAVLTKLFASAFYRHAAREPARGAAVRRRDRHGRVDVGLRARDGRRRPPARIPRRRPA